MKPFSPIACLWQAVPACCLVVPLALADTVAYWRFEEASSGAVPASPNVGGSITDTVLDGSGQGNHLQTWIWYTAPTYTAGTGFAAVPSTTSANGSSLGFDGAWNDLYTSSKPINAQVFSAWSVEASFRLDATGRWQVIVGKDGNPVGGQPPFSLKVSNTNVLEVGMVDGSGAARSVIGTRELAAGKWYHAVATADGDTLTLWLKGEGESADIDTPGGVGLWVSAGRSRCSCRKGVAGE